MKIVVIGGSGLIGKKLVPILRKQGHEAVSASPSSGVNALTGEGLAEALAGAHVVVDVSNSPSWADAAVMEFFDTSTRNLLAAEAAAGVGHHVALSVVGADRMPDSGYMRAKVNQEKLIEAGGVPYSIVRATQFFEFLGGIADSGAEGDTVRLSTAPMQPLAADDVAAALAGTWCRRHPTSPGRAGCATDRFQSHPATRTFHDPQQAVQLSHHGPLACRLDLGPEPTRFLRGEECPSPDLEEPTGIQPVQPCRASPPGWGCCD